MGTLERHIQAAARGAAGAGGGLEEQEVEQPGAEQVLHLPFELDPWEAAGESGGLSDKWNDGKGGKNTRTGWDCLPLFPFGSRQYFLLLQCLHLGLLHLTSLQRLDGDGFFTSQPMWSGQKISTQEMSE